jgi:hypothetical protein
MALCEGDYVEAVKPGKQPSPGLAENATGYWLAVCGGIWDLGFAVSRRHRVGPSPPLLFAPSALL